MQQLQAQKDALEQQLQDIEATILREENEYLQSEYSQYGTVLKGFDGFLASKTAERGRKGRILKPEDRLMSLSSKSSPVMKETELGEFELPGPGGVYGKKGYAQKGYGQKGYNQKGKR